ncbi:hypothetical protein ACFYR1_44905 [Streptomyces canus]|uniref:hypothetical protein n=1 Tax=Streptomyces canus TaxID=58343 RepID=UPI0036766190
MRQDQRTGLHTEAPPPLRRAVVRREWEDTLVVDVGQRSESEETGPHAWVAWNSGVAGSIDDTDPFAAEPCWPIEDGDDLPVSASR